MAILKVPVVIDGVKSIEELANRVLDEYEYKGRTIREWADLISEIPQHGRLIDADAFIKEECNSCDGACESIPCDCLNCVADCRCDFMKDIADAPTIIPAEEDE